MRLAGSTWREIADHFGVAGESTIREGLRRYLGETTRDTTRSNAAHQALAARWQQLTHRTFGCEIEFHTAIRGEVADALEQVLGYHIHLVGYHGNQCVVCGNAVRGYSQWKLETDSSATSGMNNAGVHRHNQGGELVSPVLSGPQGLEEIKKVMKALRSVGAKVDYRHGMHIHIGVADIISDPTKVRTLFENLQMAQTTLYQLVAPSRRTNHYCNPVSSMKFSRWAHGDFSTCNHTDGVNVSNINRIGTIEMRMHQGSLNGKKATEWVNFLVALFDASAEGVVITHSDHVLATLKTARKLTNANYEWLVNRKNQLNPTAIAA
jgi:hypothetical protein